MGELVFVHLGFGEQAAEYNAAWDVQRRLHERRVAGDIPDVCLLLEHQAVYTAGKRTEPLDRPVGDPGAPVVETDRGGKITWHGPGQLVGYPIVALDEPIDVVGYVRRVEEAMIRLCAQLSIPTMRVEGRSGVWLAADPERGLIERKIGALGIRVSRGVTMHGLQLNCDCDMSWYDKIVPCGISDAGTTSLSRELGRDVPVAEAVPPAERHLAEVLGATATRHAALEEVLGAPAAVA